MTPTEPPGGVLEEVVALELRLFDAYGRPDDGELAMLLHPRFEELSATGRVYDRWSALAAHPDDALRGLTVDHLAAEELVDGAVLVTYRSHRAERAAWRTSLWLRTRDGWRLRHHAATPLRGPVAV